MKKTILKQILAGMLATWMLLATACTTTQTPADTQGESETATPIETTTQGDETSGGEDETNPEESQPATPPSVSLDLLTFTPASPAGQVLTEKGNSPQIIITNYNETATDALGRVLPTSEETGLPKEDKYVGLFYSLWTADISAPVDNSKVMATNPYNPDFGGRYGFCFWTEPETGYHKADDVWQIKRDMYYFAMAGVDFLYIDMTNGFLYEDAMTVFLDTCLELRESGIMTPYVVPWCFGTNIDGQGDIGKFYDLFYCNEKYADMWFYWEGKPLALIKPLDSGSYPVLRDAELKDKLTFRKAWTGSGRDYWVDNYIVNFEYGYGFSEHPKIAECCGIGCAGFANYGHGRSGELSLRKNLDKFLLSDASGQGLVLEAAFNQVMEKNPETSVLLLSRWNEWIAQNFTNPADKGTDTGFVDQFNAEFSRDMEPMKGGFTDNYFYQMCSIIRRFKGVLPADGNTGAQTVDISGSFDAWQNIAPTFGDFAGDTSHRDATDTTGRIKYVNQTGRNDIVESRLTANSGMVYAYARTASAMTDPQTSNHWMLLFIDADNDKTTGWEGYDFLINYHVLSDTQTTICAYQNDVWQEIGVVNYKVEGNQLMVAIPRSLMGLTADTFTLNFHWMDNLTNLYVLESWFTTGDSAPERRNNYTLTLTVAYDATAERKLPPRDNGIKTMPALSFTEEQAAHLTEGLQVTRYWLAENYGVCPEFRLIEANKVSTAFASTIAPVAEACNYALSYDGCILVDKDDTYTFTLTYDDGARLYIDDRLVIQSDDTKREASQKVTATCKLSLAAGYHKIKVEYAETGNGQATLSLAGDWNFYAGYVPTYEEFNLKVAKTMSGGPGYREGTDGFGPRLEAQNGTTVFYLGEIDLSQYTAVEIFYGSGKDSKLGDEGCFFALDDVSNPVKNQNSADIFGAAKAENAIMSWQGDRTAVIDLSQVTHNGKVYLTFFMGHTNGINIYSIRFVGRGATSGLPNDGADSAGYELEFSTVKTLQGGPGYSNGSDGYGVRLDAQNGTTVLNLGVIDLSKYARVEITYGSDGNSKLGDEGCFFALDDSTTAVTNQSSPDIFGAAKAENATATWQGDRTAVIDLSQVTYKGTVYLTFYMGHINGISIYSILLIPAE